MELLFWLHGARWHIGIKDCLGYLDNKIDIKSTFIKLIFFPPLRCCGALRSRRNATDKCHFNGDGTTLLQQGPYAVSVYLIWTKQLCGVRQRARVPHFKTCLMSLTASSESRVVFEEKYTTSSIWWTWNNMATAKVCPQSECQNGHGSDDTPPAV